MLRQHGQLAESQNQQGVARALEYEADAVAVEDIDPLYFLQVGAVLRMALLEQQPIGKSDVIGGDRFTVMEARLGSQVEHHPAAVLAVLDRLGDQSVTGSRFVAGRIVAAGAGHQGFVQFGDAILQEVGGGDRAGAFERIGVEGVEGAGSHEAHRAAFGGVGVDPVEVGKAGGVFERAELGIAMALADARPGGKADGQTEQ